MRAIILTLVLLALAGCEQSQSRQEMRSIASIEAESIGRGLEARIEGLSKRLHEAETQNANLRAELEGVKATDSNHAENIKRLFCNQGWHTDEDGDSLKCPY